VPAMGHTGEAEGDGSHETKRLARGLAIGEDGGKVMCSGDTNSPVEIKAWGALQ